MYGQYELDDINGGAVGMGSAWGIDKSPSYGYAEDKQRSRVRSPYMDVGEYVECETEVPNSRIRRTETGGRWAVRSPYMDAGEYV